VALPGSAPNWRPVNRNMIKISREISREDPLMRI
jgi:hypothetical protein